ncbi:sodium:solute symporter [Amylibacter ulvae]|uniref:histidine kinase n=1 Tax=Paramylibacter ulvae TaxID=1651968 RepID=A0ABQ3CTA0_9RHOB|nr:sensor histidine kinase [Amylibacter ulvae]GHA42755.1 sodium:solute symporter [Amylibacter ulvae]
MLSFNLIVTISLLYVACLFGIAALAETRAKQGKMGFIESPFVYTLSISVYCTAWTFYGAVGSAARNGLEFLTIYLGPTLVFIGWWWFLRKLVRIGRTQRITSIADLISSRYGKSNLLGVLVTILAVVGSTPYIALQLQSLTLSFTVFTQGSPADVSPAVTALLIALGLAAFTIVFGTRNLDANERHHGVVTAIAIEAIVKLAALIAVGVFVVWGVTGGPSETLALMEQRLPQTTGIFSPRWVTLTFLSATAIICLPRMFQVVVVENAAERHLATASWAFPMYLFLMCIFVVPIAVTGLNILPEGSNPDLFVLTIPLSENRAGLAAFAFLGGFSSATSMVIVAAIALSTMISNHIVLPLWLYTFRRRIPESDDIRMVLLRSRRISIAVILGLGYLYFILTGGRSALASIGYIAFLGVAQVLPALVGGLFWRNATRMGAFFGISVGFAVWAYTLFLPSFAGGFVLTESTIIHGPFGISALRPQALFGISISDPLIHAVFWSIFANTLAFVVVSLSTSPRPLERVQAQQFINVYGQPTNPRPIESAATPEELYILAQRILGRHDAKKLFAEHAKLQGRMEGLPHITTKFMETLERNFAGSVGAATAHAMIGQAIASEAISVEDLIAVADETAQVLEYSARLEDQSKVLKKTAEELRAANTKLTKLGRQKDDFLSKVSHELRTPMTSIRSFSEILHNSENLDRQTLKHFSSVINDESQRLTHLLDEILDLSFLESGRLQLTKRRVQVSGVVERVLKSTQQIVTQAGAKISYHGDALNAVIETDTDRLSQVFINLITNSVKYSDKDTPTLTIECRLNDGDVDIIFSDDGPGIPTQDHAMIFEKFIQLSSNSPSGSVGLGLPISQEIMKNLGGSLRCVPNDDGAVFVVTLPR